MPGQIRSAFGQTDRIAQQSGRNAGRSFSGALGSSLKTLAGVAGVTAGFATIGGAVKSAMTAGLDFTNALNTMQAVAGASASEVARVSAEARKLGTDSQLAATSSTDAANAMLELAKGGFTVEQSMQAARGTLQLAAAAQISAADAATIQSQALQAFGKDATYAGKTADILANAANASSADITDVAQALQQSGTVANQFGVSMSDTAASIALLANAGIKGSDAGTLLKSTLLALTDGSDQAQTQMEKLGLTVYDAQGKFVGMESLFGQLNTASKKMTDQEYQAATAILFGSDAMRLSGLAAQQGADGFAKMRTAMDQTGSAADVAAAKMQGLPGAWEALKNTAQDAGLAFYDAVQGPLTTAANKASDVLEGMVSGATGAGDKIREAFANERIASFLQSVRDNGASAFTGLIQSAAGLGAALSESLTAAGTISGALGISAWTVFLEVLRASAGALQVVAPLLAGVGSIASNNAGLATAMVGAFLAFRFLPPLMGRVRDSIAPVTTAMGNARSSAQNFIATNTAMSQGLLTNRTLMMQMAGVMQTANGRWQTLSGQSLTAAQAMARLNSVASSGVTSFGRFGSAVSQIGNHMPVVTRMQASFVNAAIGAERFGRSAGVAAAATTGLRSAGSAMLGAFGGPLGAAITGAVAYLGLAASAHADNTQKARAQSAAVKDLAKSEVELGSALSQSRGAMSDNVWAKAGEQLGAYQKTLKTTADQHKSTWDQLKEIGGVAKIIGHSNDELNANSERAMAAQKALTGLKMTNEDLSRSLYGSAGQWKTTSDRLVAMGEGGVKAAAELTNMRNEFVQQRDISSRIVPGVTELGDAIRLMGDKGASASDKLNALKSAMDAMNPARSKTEAMAQYGETIRKTAEAMQGIDGSAFKGGQIDALSESGSNLSRMLGELAEKSAQVASTGGDMGAVTARNEETFRQLAVATGQPIEKIRQLYAELGGTAVDLAVNLKGAPEVTQQIAAISAQWNTMPEQKSIEVRESAVNNETRAALERMKIQVSEPKNGVVTITANDADARAKLLLITQNVNVLNALKANPKIDLNKTLFDGRSEEARAALAGLDRTTVSPEAGLVIDQLLQGKAVSMEQLNILSQTTANPKVDMEIAAIMQKLGLINTELDRTARERQAYINVQTRGLNLGDTTPSGQVFRGPGLANNADGSVRRYAQGGIHALEQYANGKLPSQAVIEKARPNTLVQWAEPETGGEAFIPLAPGKRGRSTSILATVASLFGFNLVPRDQLPDSMSGLLGAVAGGAVKRLVQGAGADGVRRFADGGILRRLADGEGASGPLTGSPYVWGGINWGDCSAAMSAFARKAAGLDPFGGRFTTATMGSQIQQMGGQLGRGGSGDMRFGWYNGGAGGGHTAGTLPDGTNVEMGGSNGGGMVGGSVGADDPQFTEHAFIKVDPSWTDPGSDSGGWVQRPDGTWAQTGPGGFDATGGFGSTGAGGSGDDKSLSGRLGNAASAFVSGQVQDFLGLISANDSPGWLAAITEYENQLRAGREGSGRSVSPEERERAKAEYDAAKDSLKSDYENAKLTRKQDYEQKKQALENDFTLKKIDRATYERKLNELKHAHENDELAKKQEYDSRVAEAKSKYDSATGKAPGSGTSGADPSAKLDLKQKYEDEKLARKQRYDEEKARRKERYEADKKALAAQKLSTELNKKRSDELKAQYDSDVAGMKARYESAELAKKQEYERAANSVPSMSSPGVRPGVTDPGTTKPRPGEDLGGTGGAPTGNAVKDAFRSGLREGWRQGPPWEATDWIINKESSWNPTATNAESGAFGLPQFLGSTKDQYLPDSSPDPRRQGEAYDAYVGDRYGDPLRAKEHHVNAGWYERGGVIHEGANVMLNGLGHKETALPFDPRDLKASLDRGGVDPQMGSKLDRMINLLEVMAQSRPNVHYHGADDRSVKRAQRTERQRVSAALGSY
ncbi:phage tail tape measure protein [Gordonia alkanivorans]|uniref:phage tail tape measure protein n=1 Tax=Gordonia alkanivorans TaxID=84096 RepID=UPI0024B6835A|nr:phage tail tape measure protein [Gordonia alkanivorans]MDJ0010093.1 phage tail tape measure protein [Gordonia alkanivorans]MDJ0495717.1 phage tail tape measure protein [Gordonia alkanivorans]